MKLKIVNIFLVFIAGIFSVKAQSLVNPESIMVAVEQINADSLAVDSLPPGYMLIDSIPVDTTINVDDLMQPDYVYVMPPVFGKYYLFDSNANPLKRTGSSNESVNWIERQNLRVENQRRFMQSFYINNPDLVKYNVAWLPEPPKQYVAVADPEKAIIVIEEIEVNADDAEHDISLDVDKKHWLSKFNGSVQFSQAYNSPNWYQGGNSNLNLLLNLLYSISLNPAYHPNLLFETTFQYKLAMNSAPDDSLRNYNIAEDLFQINSKFGVKAVKHWYYTVTLQAKTQFLNNYKVNSHTLSASFMSPGELNVSVGMTYNYANPKKTVQFETTIAPGSWNLKSCINRRMNPADFDIKPGHKFVNQFGSSLDAKLTWQIAYNISLTTRLFAFTDYDYLQGDLENTINFSINKYLSTKLYVHLRYDSSTPRIDDSRWHTWQLREILSFGFSYAFSTI